MLVLLVHAAAAGACCWCCSRAAQSEISYPSIDPQLKYVKKLYKDLKVSA
jgi:hypothetical protein